MSVVGSQQERTNWLSDANFGFQEQVKNLLRQADEYGMTVSELIAFRRVLAMEAAVRTSWEDGDYRDEHIHGICLALQQIAEAISDR